MYKPSTLPNSRIDAADVLRGFAIAGIILIHFLEHMNFYSFPELTKLDENVWDTIFFLFAGKMYAIFAMLFGLSFFIQHDNQAQKGEDFRPRFVWSEQIAELTLQHTVCVLSLLLLSQHHAVLRGLATLVVTVLAGREVSLS